MSVDLAFSLWWTMMVFCVGYLSSFIQANRMKNECLDVLRSAEVLEERTKEYLDGFLEHCKKNENHNR